MKEPDGSAPEEAALEGLWPKNRARRKETRQSGTGRNHRTGSSSRAAHRHATADVFPGCLCHREGFHPLAAYGFNDFQNDHCVIGALIDALTDPASKIGRCMLKDGSASHAVMKGLSIDRVVLYCSRGEELLGNIALIIAEHMQSGDRAFDQTTKDGTGRTHGHHEERRIESSL